MSAFLRKYNTATHVYVPIVKRAVVDFAVGADWTPQAGDVKVSIDGAAVANIGTLPVAIASGNGAFWDFTVSAAELLGKKITVTVVDAATKAVEDQCFVIETYGNASAEHPFDLGTASSAQTGDSFARIGVAGAGLTNIDLPNQTMDIVGNITGNLSGSVGSVTGAVGSVTGAVGSVTGAVGSVGAGGIAAASFAAGAIDATAIAANAIGASELASDVITDIWQGTAITEAYAADGVAATPAQLLYMIWAFLAEKNIASTTLTAKKLDGATSAMTFTLDSATAPTTITRAT